MHDVNILYVNGAAKGSSVTRDVQMVDCVAWGLWHVFSTLGFACTPVQISLLWGEMLEAIPNGSSFSSVYRSLTKQIMEKMDDLSSSREFSKSALLHFTMWQKPRDGIQAKRYMGFVDNDIVRSQEQMVLVAHKLEPLLKMAEQLALVKPNAKVVKAIHALEEQARDLIFSDLESIVNGVKDCEEVMARDRDQLIQADLGRVSHYQPIIVKRPGIIAMGLRSPREKLFNSWGKIAWKDQIFYTNGNLVVADPLDYDVEYNNPRLHGQSMDDFFENIHAKSRLEIHPAYCVDVEDRDEQLKQIVLMGGDGHWVGVRKVYMDYLLYKYPGVIFRTDPDPLSEEGVAVVAAYLGQRLVAMINPLQPKVLRDSFDAIESLDELSLMAA